mmetsp:Transcript_96693/g.133216  ORF Transcript_96693/g.133216 Transcript_96693/m.133216 type:complete len:95 (+) Transcript_96693:8-292(+)|eukprot:CAMPEP_0176378520 /NCGR_PEP_ID=MMETSP0126-20121128/29680_1 /TAXON_ID=141414 ORGANISM="Strombidinopsis acuminatum, Strain SPMC142" /NCGR_SAMPLE_ID=MMETSP0126 /ASSEMBLY_ACC=CAM_ASM_000229 /LENGTH=94 /DNA_ID=CAMNT_0017740859 /DNA_START=7 /DNA_END=291 /DNA_ORIENTATION=+
MSGSNNNHFNPGRTHEQYMVFNNDRMKYQGNKFSVVADLMATEFCMNKCNFNFSSSNSLSNNDTGCMRQCVVKYNDSSLVIENEMTNYVQGNLV